MTLRSTADDRHFEPRPLQRAAYEAEYDHSGGMAVMDTLDLRRRGGRSFDLWLGQGQRRAGLDRVSLCVVLVLPMTRGLFQGRKYEADDRSICCLSSAQKQVDRAAIDPTAIAAAEYGRPGTGRALRGCGRLPILGRWRLPWASGRCC
jgi:hypothetical protein